VATLGVSAPVRILTKPLVAVLLAVTAWQAKAPGPRRLSIGLLAAAAGDELLLSDESTRFLLGMVCFAVMHGWYIAAYLALSAGRIKPRPVVNAALTVAVVFIVLTIAPHAGNFAWPLVGYSIVLAVMVLFALDLVGNIDGSAAWPIALGALAFMLSDILLAFVKFYPRFPLSGTNAELAVVGTYFAAQIAIASGVVRSAQHGRNIGGSGGIRE
jgi:uncharacterized membrane protein YhhN